MPVTEAGKPQPPKRDDTETGQVEKEYFSCKTQTDFEIRNIKSIVFKELTLLIICCIILLSGVLLLLYFHDKKSYSAAEAGGSSPQHCG